MDHSRQQKPKNGALQTTQTIQQPDPRPFWIPLSFLRWCAYCDYMPNRQSAELYLEKIKALAVSSEFTKQLPRDYVRQLLISMVHLATKSKWAGRNNYEGNEFDEFENRSIQLGNIVNAAAQKHILASDDPILLYCAGNFDSAERYCSGTMFADAAAANASLGNPGGSNKEIVNVTVKMAHVNSNPLFRICADIWLMMRLEGIIIDARPAEFAREAVTEPAQCPGGLRGWHLETSGELKTLVSLNANSDIGEMYCLHYAQVSEAMYDGDKGFGANLEYDRKWLEYTAPGIEKDFQARLVVSPETGDIFFSPLHFRYFFHMVPGDDLLNALHELDQRLIKWFDHDSSVLSRLPTLQGLPHLIAAKGQKAATPAPATATPTHGNEKTVGALLEELWDKLGTLWNTCNGRKVEALDALCKNANNIELFGYGLTRADARFDANKAKQCEKIYTNIFKSIEAIAKDQTYKDLADKVLGPLRQLQEQLSKIGSGPHLAAVLNLVWYALKQKAEDAAVTELISKKGHTIEFTNSSTGDHLLNDLPGRIGRAEVLTGVHVLKLECNVLQALREARAIRAVMVKGSGNVDMASNSWMWPFAGDYLEYVLATSAEKEPSVIESLVHGALVIILRACFDQSVATRIRGNQPHSITTLRLGQDAPSLAVERVQEILRELRSKAPQIAKDVADQFGKIFPPDAPPPNAPEEQSGAAQK